MYDVRRHFTNADADEPRVIAVDFEFMRDFDPTGGTCPNMACRTVSDKNSFLIALLPISPGTASLSLIQQPVVAPLAANPPLISPIQSSPIFAYSPFYSSTYSLGHPLVIWTTRPSVSAPSPFSPLPTPPISTPPVLDIKQNPYFNPRYSPSQDSLHALGMVTPTPSAAYYDSTNTSARSSPTDTTVVQTQSASVLNFNDPVPEEAPLASGLLEAAKKIQETCK